MKLAKYWKKVYPNKWTKNIWHRGPLQFYQVTKDDTLCVSLLCCQDQPWGWQYGWRDEMRGNEKPLLEFRIGKLMMLYFTKYKKGFEVWVLGFWWIK